MDLCGEDASLHGDRWTHIGIPFLYTSQNRKLAVLKLSVNVSTTTILHYLSVVEIEIPDDLLELDTAAQPGNWREAPAPAFADISVQAY